MYIKDGDGSHIFFLAKLYLKRGISSEYVMVDFICMYLLNLWGVRIQNYKMKILTHSGIRTRYRLLTTRSELAKYFATRSNIFRAL